MNHWHPRFVCLAFVATMSVALPFCGSRALSQGGPSRNPERVEAWFRPEANPVELRAILKDKPSPRWIFHDLEAARTEARRTGKPILALFKCVPCGSAPAFDEAVIGANSPLADQLDKFICVRVVKMNGVNRHLFDFDRDVPLVAMFLAADGTVYGRYGSMLTNSRRDLPHHTVPSFGKSLERVLALHADRFAHADALEAKRTQAETTPWTDDLPTLDTTHNPPELKNCIHCHMVGEASLGMAMRERKLELRDVWPFPPVANLGVKLDLEDGLRINGVRENSIAAAAGVQPGDQFVRMAGQPLVSEADITWILHHLADDARPTVSLRRGGKLIDVQLSLTGDWRKGRIERASLNPLRFDFLLRVDSHPDRKLVPAGQMGLVVYYPRGRAAQAGLRQADLLIAVNDRTDLLTEPDVMKYLNIDLADVDTAELRILRKGIEHRITFSLK